MKVAKKFWSFRGVELRVSVAVEFGFKSFAVSGLSRLRVRPPLPPELWLATGVASFGSSSPVDPALRLIRAGGRGFEDVKFRV